MLGNRKNKEKEQILGWGRVDGGLCLRHSAWALPGNSTLLALLRGRRMNTTLSLRRETQWEAMDSALPAKVRTTGLNELA